MPSQSSCSLIKSQHNFRLNDEMQMNNFNTYLDKGKYYKRWPNFNITCLINTQIDVLLSPNIGKRVFKLSKLLYYGFEHLTIKRKVKGLFFYLSFSVKDKYTDLEGLKNPKFYL